MQIRSKRNNHYRGDESTAIQYLHENGQWQTLFNLYPKSERGKRIYENDRYPGAFMSVAEAKDYAAQILDN